MLITSCCPRTGALPFLTFRRFAAAWAEDWCVETRQARHQGTSARRSRWRTVQLGMCLNLKALVYFLLWRTSCSLLIVVGYHTLQLKKETHSCLRASRLPVIKIIASGCPCSHHDPSLKDCCGRGGEWFKMLAVRPRYLTFHPKNPTCDCGLYLVLHGLLWSNVETQHGLYQDQIYVAATRIRISILNLPPATMVRKLRGLGWNVLWPSSTAMDNRPRRKIKHLHKTMVTIPSIV